MKQILIIPDINNLEESIALINKYSFGFEYNDFFHPDILDDENKLNEIIEKYKSYKLPKYSTVHGAFFDVIPFSVDSKIREISKLRIEQSINVAYRLGAKAVIFHTNYNPFLNAPSYVEGWIEENVKFWKDIIKKNPNMGIYLENMFDMTPDILEKMGEKLSIYDNFGICLDYAHAALSKVEPHIWAEKLGQYIKHIHINDNDLVSDLHLAWGNGKIDRKLFYESYDKYMSKASILIETSSMENKIHSVEMLKNEGFMVKNRRKRDMEIIKTQEGETLKVELIGRLDTTTGPELESNLKENLDGVTELILDFEQLDYVSSAGLRVLLMIQKIMNKQGSMVIKNASEAIIEVFDITGFIDILTVE